MDYYCEACDKYFKPQSKCKQFKSTIHKQFDKCKHKKLTIENPHLNDVDGIFYSYIIELNKQLEYYLIKFKFNLVSNDNQYCPYVTSKLSDNKTMISLSYFLEKVIDDFKSKGYTFNHRAEMNITKIANKLDMAYDFNTKHNMHAVEWKLNDMINKNKNF